MTREELVEVLTENEAITFDGLESALVGVGQQHSRNTVAIYDRDLCIEAFVAQGMTYEEAQDWMGHNVDCLWAGESTPIIATFVKDDE